MPAPTKIWTVPVPARQDPAVPITTSWGNDIVDNADFVMQWLGNDYLANASQNHNHDGVNSAKVNVFTGLIPNGGFDDISGGLPISWSATEYVGGTVASSNAVNKSGEYVLAITSTILANGGGFAQQDEYKPVVNSVRHGVEIYRWASVANVSCQVDLEWYDENKALISTTTLFTDTNTPTVATRFSTVASSPSNARFVRALVHGGLPASGAAVGTVYFDALRLVQAVPDGLINAAAISSLPNNMVTAAIIATGAVGQSEIAANAVHTSELAESLASASTSGFALSVVLTGGLYVFFPQHKTTANDSTTFFGGAANDTNPVIYNATSYATRHTFGSNDGTASCQWRYVSASPPHDMGDGDIPLFIYGLVDKSGNIISLSVAEEPVWLFDGPTNAMPDIHYDGVKYKKEKLMPEGLDKLDFLERKIAIAEAPDILVEITPEIIHADMDIIPHPFMQNDLTDLTPVLLDPVCDTVRTLANMHSSGESVNELIHDGYVIIGNDSLSRVTPNGLLIPETNWKKSK